MLQTLDDSTAATTLSHFNNALDSFLSSDARFHVAAVISSGPQSRSQLVHATSQISRDAPKCIYILDSSFNPPTRAHISLAISAVRDALRKHRTTQESPTQQPKYYYPPPYRLLLLFSVHNADKSPSPAAFEQRLAMMYLTALDIVNELEHLSNSEERRNQGLALEGLDVDIDVGLTKEPFYSDKSAAIDATPAYTGNIAPTHVHLVGHDTFLRLLDPKYYSANPPLSALGDFFNQHALRITLRATDEEEALRQQETWEALRRGDMASQGAQQEWAEKIEMVDAEEESVGVSSTAVRKACEDSNWHTVQNMCTNAVADWIKDQSVYVTANPPSAGKI